MQPASWLHKIASEKPWAGVKVRAIECNMSWHKNNKKHQSDITIPSYSVRNNSVEVILVQLRHKFDAHSQEETVQCWTQVPYCKVGEPVVT